MTLLVIADVLYSLEMKIEGEPNTSKNRVYLRAYQRIYRIDREIAAETFPNAKTLAELLNVNQRTVIRDLNFLRDEFNAPIVYDYLKRGFRYKEPGWTLPLQHLTEGEILGFFIAENALKFTGNSAQALQLRQALVKLSVMLPEKVMVNLSTLGENIRFQNLPFVTVEPQFLQKVAQTAINQESVEFDYYSPHSQKQTHRIADIHLLHNFIGDWYAISFDHQSGQMRDFHVGRMSNLKSTGNYFEMQKSWNADDYLKQGFYMMRGGKLVTVEIHFDKFQAQWIRERQFFHSDEQREDLPDGGLRLSFKIGEKGLEAVARFCLTYAGHCRAEKPEKLKTLVKEKLLKGLNLHQ